MLRLNRPSSLAAAGAAVCTTAFVALLRSGFGIVPLLRQRLSAASRSGPVPIRASTALLFRVLVLWRWLRGNNDAAPGLAARYVARAEAELAGEGAAEPERLEEISASRVDPEAFLRDWRRNPRPVAIRGLLSAKRDWDPAALVRDFGETPVLFNETSGFALRPLAALEDRDAPRYVANCEALLTRHPELLEALDVPGLGRWTGMRAYCVQLFIGARARSGLTYHCANNVNLFLMLHGRKRWTLVDPESSYRMYPWITREAAYVASIVNHAEIPADQHPLYRGCPRSEVVLEPGDALLNPPWWWHQVVNLDELTVGCATRWAGLPIPETNRLFSFAQALSRDPWSTTFHTLVDLLETGGDLDALYRRQAGNTTTRIERVSHTREQHQPGAVGMRSWPRAGAPGA
jgi:hypothetical protein